MGESSQGEGAGVDWSIAESPERGEEMDGESGDIEDGKEVWEDHTNDLAFLKEKMLGSRFFQPRHGRGGTRQLPPSAAARSDAVKTRAKKEGEQRWHALLAERFISGQDENFDYGLVDGDESLNGDWTGSRAQEKWFEEEESAIDGTAEGETGIQDF